MVEIRLDAFAVFKRWQVRCEWCGAMSYVDTEPNSKIDELAALGEIRCGLHPREGSVIELA